MLSHLLFYLIIMLLWSKSHQYLPTILITFLNPKHTFMWYLAGKLKKKKACVYNCEKKSEVHWNGILCALDVVEEE